MVNYNKSCDIGTFYFSTGSVLDAVVAAVTVMEDDAAFNAGRGSKLTIMGRVEMDAAIMEGLGMRAGQFFYLKKNLILIFTFEIQCKRKL
jgi:isoaspartyl peptidase/L-asparaginase-like protein (Ntn-hydrolase superfamily)